MRVKGIIIKFHKDSAPNDGTERDPKSQVEKIWSSFFQQISLCNIHLESC